MRKVEQNLGDYILKVLEILLGCLNLFSRKIHVLKTTVTAVDVLCKDFEQQQKKQVLALIGQMVQHVPFD